MVSITGSDKSKGTKLICYTKRNDNLKMDLFLSAASMF